MADSLMKVKMGMTISHEEHQQNEERFDLEHFLQAIDLEFNFIERGTNPPDFFVFLGDKKRVGIEITEFHSSIKDPSGNSRRVVEEEWSLIQKLLTREREKFAELNKVFGWIAFKELTVPPQRNHQKFVMEILEFSQNVVKQLTRNGSNFCSFDSRFPLLSKYVSKIRLSIIDCYASWDWNHGAGFVGLNEQEMMEALNEKMRISRSLVIEENWLLVVSGHQLSQAMGIPHVEKLNGFHHLGDLLKGGPYEKVFVFQRMFGRILRWQNSDGWTEIRKLHSIGTKKELLESFSAGCNVIMRGMRGERSI